MSSVQFILGRSGSGKTWWCLEAIRRQLAEAPEGPTLILLVPDQATFQMEQALLAEGPLAGYHRACIRSFSRLAHEVIAQTGPLALPVLSEPARLMLLRRLLQEHREELKVFGKSADRNGFIAQLSRTLTELRQYEKTPTLLRTQREELLMVGPGRHTLLADKLADLALVMETYQQRLAGRFVDPDDFLDLLSQRAAQAPMLKGTHVWIDGFAGFHPQQYTALKALLTTVAAGSISLCLDGRNTPPLDHPIADTELFGPTLETYQRLRRLISRTALTEAKPILLPIDTGRPIPRFEAAPALEHLERCMSGHAGAAPWGEDSPTLRLFEATNRREEVNAVAREILRLCRDRGYRFRDIAVILRDFAGYDELLTAGFREHGIAYFLDQRKPLRRHPLVELLLSGLAVLTDNFSTADVLACGKTDLTGLTRTEVDILENEALAHGIDHARWHDPQPWHYGSKPQEVDLSRRHLVDPLIDLRQQLYGNANLNTTPLPIRQFTHAWFAWLTRLNVATTLGQWHHQALRRGDNEAADIHQQAWNQVMVVLDDLVATLGEVPVTLSEYSEILTAALGQLTLGLVPPVLDQVLIGTIERSRHPRIRAAFVLGVNEQAFPKVASPDPLLSDAQRQHLLDAGFELAPTRTQRLLHEHYLGYIALTRPQEFLWVSYPLADEQGKELNPSPLIAVILRSTGTTITRLPTAAMEAHPDHITHPDQLGRQLALALSPRRNHEPIDPLWPTLLHEALARPEWSPRLRHSLRGLTYRNQASLTPALRDSLWGTTLVASISRLETFAACPFRHFARYVLELRPREVLELSSLDMGNYYHRALKDMFLRLQQENLTWQTANDGTLDRWLTDITAGYLRQDSDFMELQQLCGRNRYLLERARGQLGYFCRWLSQMARAGQFQQIAAEAEFGPGRKMPPLEIPLSHQATLLLEGKIDRVDACRLTDALLLTVIDFKSSVQAFAWDEFYHGLSLQLPTYLLALQNHYQQTFAQAIEPVAACYLPIRTEGKKQNGPPPKDPAAPSATHHKAKGLFNGDRADCLDQTLEPKKTSAFYPIYQNAEGSVYNYRSKGVLTPPQTQAVLTHCRRKLAELAEALRAGAIVVAPYRLNNTSPCRHCDYRAVCRFDPQIEPYRTLLPLDPATILEHLTADINRL